MLLGPEHLYDLEALRKPADSVIEPLDAVHVVFGGRPGGPDPGLDRRVLRELQTDSERMLRAGRHLRGQLRLAGRRDTQLDTDAGGDPLAGEAVLGQDLGRTSMAQEPVRKPVDANLTGEARRRQRLQHGRPEPARDDAFLDRQHQTVAASDVLEELAIERLQPASVYDRRLHAVPRQQGGRLQAG